jgi:hypothetical protein
VLSALLAAAFIFPAPARASSPTLLSLEQDCRAALESSATVEEMAHTWCGAFLSGYVMGLFYANAIILTTPENACAPDWKIAHNHVEGRICMPMTPIVKQKRKFNFYQVATALLSLRLDFLKENGTESPALSALRGSLSEPVFCAIVAEKVKDKDVALPPVNPAFLDALPLIKLGDDQLIATQSDYTACAQDIKDSGGKNAAFRKTKCGAEMEGLLLGMTSVDYSEARPAFSPACEKEIGRMYANLDTWANYCISKKIDALAAVRAMMAEIDRQPNHEALKYRSFVELSSKLPRFLCNAPDNKKTGKKK